MTPCVKLIFFCLFHLISKAYRVNYEVTSSQLQNPEACQQFRVNFKLTLMCFIKCNILEKYRVNKILTTTLPKKCKKKCPTLFPD